MMHGPSGGSDDELQQFDNEASGDSCVEDWNAENADNDGELDSHFQDLSVFEDTSLRKQLYGDDGQAKVHATSKPRQLTGKAKAEFLLMLDPVITDTVHGLKPIYERSIHHVRFRLLRLKVLQVV
jgi:hypothetical protein